MRSEWNKILPYLWGEILILRNNMTFRVVCVENGKVKSTRLTGTQYACQSSANCMTEHMRKAGIKSIRYDVMVTRKRKNYDVVLPESF